MKNPSLARIFHWGAGHVAFCMLYSPYMDWRTKRQFIIIFALLILCGIGAALIIIPRLIVPPTCFDGKKNGTEHGIDCGGGCTQFCPEETTNLVLQWARSFPVTDSVWSSIAYVSNPNIDGSVAHIEYQFKLYDADRQFIAQRDGETYIGANSAQAIFEPAVNVGSRIPAYTTFNFTSTPIFTRADIRTKELLMTSKDVAMTNLTTRPRVTGTVVNNSQTYTISGVDVVAILYDKDNNAIGASRTQLDSLGPEDEVPVIFTWPKPFAGDAVRYELVIRANPFTQSFN